MFGGLQMNSRGTLECVKRNMFAQQPCIPDLYILHISPDHSFVWEVVKMMSDTRLQRCYHSTNSSLVTPSQVIVIGGVSYENSKPSKKNQPFLNSVDRLYIQ